MPNVDPTVINYSSVMVRRRRSEADSLLSAGGEQRPNDDGSIRFGVQPGNYHR